MSKSGETLKPAEDQKPAPTNKPPPASVDTGDAGSMDKIRDILFGNQVRDFERRFSRMEEHLKRSAAELHDEVFKRLEALERFFREELETLKGQIKSEAERRQEAGKHLRDELKGSSSELMSALQQLEDKLSERSSELRQQILQQSKDLTSAMQTKYEQANQTLTQATERLEESKINRASLAEYLVDIAMKLSDHPGTPDAEESNA